MEELLERLNATIGEPDTILLQNEKRDETLKELTKSLYDHGKATVSKLSEESQANLNIKSSLRTLCVEGFDEDQLWGILQLENQPFIKKAISFIASISAKKRPLAFDLGQSSKSNPVKSKSAFDDIADQFDSDDENIDSSGSSDDDNELEPDGQPSKPKRVRFSEDTQEASRQRQQPKPSRSIKESIVDDKFFKLSELEEFLNREDKREERKRQDDFAGAADESGSDGDEGDEDIDLFKEEPIGPGNDANERAMFNDFFDQPLQAGGFLAQDQDSDASGDQESGSDEEGNDFDDDGEEIDTRDVEEEFQTEGKINNIYGPASSSDESEGETVEKILGSTIDRKGRGSHGEGEQAQSNFERQQEALRQKIKKMEEANLADKPWQLTGETAASRRPQNSLLQEHLQFDFVSREPPLITEETTMKLEDIIIQRIKNSSYDDVERKVKPAEQPFDFKRRIVLDQEKSKVGLAEVYEKEFIRQTQEEQVEQENAAHKEIRLMTQRLFLQLDALSNFNFTPRPPEPELKIINNLPAISAEEAIPGATSESTMLAPEEVAPKASRGDVKSATERTDTDRKRERRIKKSRQSVRHKHIQQKAQNNAGLGNKYVKLAKEKQLKAAQKSSLADDDGRAKEIEKLTKHAFSSSKSFFASLQDQITNAKKASATHKQRTNKKTTAASVNVKALKL